MTKGKGDGSGALAKVYFWLLIAGAALGLIGAGWALAAVVLFVPFAWLGLSLLGGGTTAAAKG
jgi:hypothetical protein